MSQMTLAAEVCGPGSVCGVCVVEGREVDGATMRGSPRNLASQPDTAFNSAFNLLLLTGELFQNINGFAGEEPTSGTLYLNSEAQFK